VQLWLASTLTGSPENDVWKVSLGARLREHAMLRNVLAVCQVRHATCQRC